MSRRGWIWIAPKMLDHLFSNFMCQWIHPGIANPAIIFAKNMRGAINFGHVEFNSAARPRSAVPWHRLNAIT